MDTRGAPATPQVERAVLERGAEWLRTDAALLDAPSAPDAWIEVRRDAQHGSVVERHARDPDLFRVSGVIGKRASIEDTVALFHTSIVERQAEWHHLFIDGRRLMQGTSTPWWPRAMPQPAWDVVWMVFGSGNCFVAPREFVYAKVSSWSVSEQTGVRSMQCSYRSVDDLFPNAPHSPSAVRGTMQVTAHRVTETRLPGGESGLLYEYIQKADAGGMVSAALSRRFQVSIVQQEFANLSALLPRLAERH